MPPAVWHRLFALVGYLVVSPMLDLQVGEQHLRSTRLWSMGGLTRRKMLSG
jgi:hypothetical protein